MTDAIEVLREGYGWLDHGQVGREEYDDAVDRVKALVRAAEDLLEWDHTSAVKPLWVALRAVKGEKT